MKLRSVTDLTSPEPRSQSVLKISETFMRLATLIQWTEHPVRAFEATSKSQQELVVRPSSEIRDPRCGKSVWTVFRISTQIDGRA